MFHFFFELFFILRLIKTPKKKIEKKKQKKIFKNTFLITTTRNLKNLFCINIYFRIKINFKFTKKIVIIKNKTSN